MKTRKISNIMLALACWLIIQNPLFAQTDRQQMEVEIASLMEEFHAAGLSVAVVKDGKLHYTKSFGYKNLENQTPLQENHIFRIASISKSFTSTAIMQLVEAGYFTLDSDFGDLVGFPVRNPKYPDQVITLRMVLSHTSSINDSQGYFRLDVIDPSKNPDWAKSYNDYAPGSQYQYCNLNFNMAGAVLERFTQVRFDQHINNQILRPLGLYGGYCIDSLDNSLFASLYTYNKETGEYRAAPDAYHPRREELKDYTLGYSAPIFSPTGGMKISAPDLAKYMIMHMNYGVSNGVQILQPNSSREMQQAVLESSGYGLALTNASNYIPGESMVGHTGSAYGLYSNMFFHPEKKFGLVLITNGCLETYEEGYIALLKKSANVLYQHLIAEKPANIL